VKDNIVGGVWDEGELEERGWNCSAMGTCVGTIVFGYASFPSCRTLVCVTPFFVDEANRPTRTWHLALQKRSFDPRAESLDSAVR